VAHAHLFRVSSCGSDLLIRGQPHLEIARAVPSQPRIDRKLFAIIRNSQIVRRQEAYVSPVLPGSGERRAGRDRRVGRRRSGNDRRAQQRRVQFTPVAVDYRSGHDRRTRDRRIGRGRRILGDRRAY